MEINTLFIVAFTFCMEILPGFNPFRSPLSQHFQNSHSIKMLSIYDIKAPLINSLSVDNE